MPANDRLSRKQTKFLQELLCGQTIVSAASAVGVAEKTAHRWLKLPHVQAERARLEDELRQAEEATIAREREKTLHAGLALMHKRILALSAVAEQLEGYMQDKTRVWLADAKIVATGMGKSERIDLEVFNSDLFREYREYLADIAEEAGGRIQKSELTGKGGGPIQFQPVEIYQVRLPDNGRDEG